MDHDEQAMLFDGYEPSEPLASADISLSPDRRRTLRQAEQIAAGIHPLTRGRLHPLASRHRDASAPKSDPFTCGSCFFRMVEKYHDYSFPKCWFPETAGADEVTVRGYPHVSHSSASDVRAWWPACPDYSPGDLLSPDAARSIPAG